MQLLAKHGGGGDIEQAWVNIGLYCPEINPHWQATLSLGVRLNEDVAVYERVKAGRGRALRTLNARARCACSRGAGYHRGKECGGRQGARDALL